MGCVRAVLLSDAKIDLTLPSTGAKNATTTICKRPIRDRSLVAFTVSACTGGVALFFVILRVGGNFYLERLTWADACVVLAMVRFCVETSMTVLTD